MVSEGIEDFEMEPKEALQEAIKQFKSQGVDLRSIDISGGIGRVEMEKALESLKTFTKNNTVFDAKTNTDVLQFTVEQQVAVLNELHTMCDNTKCEQYVRNRLMMNPEGMNGLIALLLPDTPDDLLVPAMKLLSMLSKNVLELRDFFEPGGSKKLSVILEERLALLQAQEPAGKHEAECAQHCIVLRVAMALARSVSKSENNKNMLSRTGTSDVISAIIINYAARAATTEGAALTGLVSDACVVMRSLCVHDDMRREMSCAMDNGKFFLGLPGLVAALMKASSAFKLSPGVAGQALAAAKTLVTTEDAVKTMALHGAMALPCEILSYPAADTTLIKNCMGLMRNLCADDIRKDKLVDDGSMRLAVAAMSKEECFVDGNLMENGAACLAAMSLRSPTNAYRIAETGSIEILVKGMRRHPTHGAFQRQCSLCMRNIAARCEDLRGSMLDAGAEEVLRSAGRIQEAVDEAYAALRDLGCEVHKVKIGQDGKVEAAYEQFGEKTATFNAVYDDVDDNNPNKPSIEEAVAREAHAPFSGDQQQGMSRPLTKPGFADEEIDHYGNDDDLLDHDHDENCNH